MAWLSLEGPASAELMARAGFDAVVLDLQHGAATLEGAAEIFRAVSLTDSLPFVRVPWNDPAVLMRVLDLGARGVICPMVGSRAEAEALVNSCRYPPDGIRSYGPVRAAFGQGREQVEDAILLFAMIETADGLANLEEIGSTPGLDGLFVGPADLSLAMGLDTFVDLSDPRLLDALDAVIDAAGRDGIVPGIHAPSSQRAVAMAARGFRLISCAVDADLLRNAAEIALKETR
jgi:4-hydroxy-2-oxoheptanedioate aldolase